MGIKTNKYFRWYGLDSQFLHGYRVVFSELDEPLDYLNNQEFIGKEDDIFEKIQEKLFE